MLIEWFLKTVNTGIWVFIGLCVCTCSYFVYQYFRKKKHQIHKHSKSNETHLNFNLNNELVAIRTLSNADRVFITRFHNGTEFLPSHPVWKMTRTHEVAAPGITYESAKHQNMLVSLFTDIVTPIVLGISEEDGISILNNPSDNDNVPLSILIDVNKLRESYCKTFFEEEHIQQILICRFDQNNNIIGYMGMDFCGTPSDIATLEKIRGKIMPHVMKIKYLLTKN